VLEMERILIDLPLSMPQDEIDRARALLQRYAELGAGLRQRILDDMMRLGAAQRLRTYQLQGQRP